MKIRVHTGNDTFQVGPSPQKILTTLQITIISFQLEKETETMILDSPELNASHIPGLASMGLIGVLLPEEQK